MEFSRANALEQPLLSGSDSTISADSSACLSLDQSRGSQDFQLQEDGQREIDEEIRRRDEKKLSVEQIFENYVGGFGRGQLIKVVIVSLAWALDSQHTLITIFTDAQPSWRCVGSHDQSAPSVSVSARRYLFPYVAEQMPFPSPVETRGERRCTEEASICDMDPALWEWVNGKETSIVSEWGLICGNKFMAGVPASLFFMGCILGAAIIGALGDSCLGRKRALMLSCLIISASGFLTAISPNIWIYACLRFVSGFGRAGVGICSLVLSTELVGRKWSGRIGLYGFVLFTAGFVSLPGVAYLTRSSWRSAYIFISILSSAYCFLALPSIWESPRWLAVRGRLDESLQILRRMAVWNGNSLPDTVSVAAADQLKAEDEGSVRSLLKVGWACRRMIVMMSVGMVVGLVYYGLPLNTGNLDFNPYVSATLNALMEIPAIALGSLLLPKVNRRLLVSGFSILCSLSCVLCAFFAGSNPRRLGNTGIKPQGLKGFLMGILILDEGAASKIRGRVQMLAEMVGFLGINTAFDVLYIFSVEMFPTAVRSVAVSMLRVSIMSGAAVAPLVVVLGRIDSSLSFLIFGGLAILSALFTLLLPETRNRPSCETLKEQQKEEEAASKNNGGISEAPPGIGVV